MDTKVKKIIPKKVLERFGLTLTSICIAIIVLLVFTLIFMVFARGLSTFFVDGINPIDFFTGTTWRPSQLDANGVPQVGALPMIAGSFAVTIVSSLIATPLAVGSALFVVEIAPGFGKRFFQPAIEILVGIPSVVYGLIGLLVVVPFTRDLMGGTGFGIFSGSIILAIMVLPTITSLSIDAIAAVPRDYRQGALALGSTRWQMIYKVVLRSALTGILTAVILGMARAFGEALAVQMIIGNAAIIPTSLFEPAATLTSVLTMGMGHTVQGTLENNALWSLAMVLLVMSLIFILIIHFIGRRGSLKEN